MFGTKQISAHSEPFPKFRRCLSGIAVAAGRQDSSVTNGRASPAGRSVIAGSSGHTAKPPVAATDASLRDDDADRAEENCRRLSHLVGALANSVLSF